MGSAFEYEPESELTLPRMAENFDTVAPNITPYVEPALDIVPQTVEDPHYGGFMAHLIETDRAHRARGGRISAKLEAMLEGFETEAGIMAKSLAGKFGHHVKGGDIGGSIRRGMGGALVAEAMKNGTPDLPKLMRMVHGSRYAPGASAIGSGPKPKSPFGDFAFGA